MDIVTWKESYSVGYEMIDNEHKVFITIIDRVHKAVNQNRPLDDINRILCELEKYAAFHFVSEENIMIDKDFPDLAAHRAEHATLMNTLRNKLEEIEAGEEDPELIVPFLLDWFILHTTERDLELAKHLTSLENK